MAKIRTATVNGGSERVGFGDMVQINGGDGRLITCAVTDITRSHGTVYLQLDTVYQVEAWYARKAKPVATIKPGSDVTLQSDTLDLAGLAVKAGSTLEVLAWREGIVTLMNRDQLVIRMPMLSLIQAAWPTIQDVRLVVWERSRLC